MAHCLLISNTCCALSFNYCVPVTFASLSCRSTSSGADKEDFLTIRCEVITYRMNDDNLCKFIRGNSLRFWFERRNHKLFALSDWNVSRKRMWQMIITLTTCLGDLWLLFLMILILNLRHRSINFLLIHLSFTLPHFDFKKLSPILILSLTLITKVKLSIKSNYWFRAYHKQR